MAVGYLGAAALEAVLSAGGVQGLGCACALGVGVAVCEVLLGALVSAGATVVEVVVVVVAAPESIVLDVEGGGELVEQAARDKATMQRRENGYCFIAGDASLTKSGIRQEGLQDRLQF